MKKISLSIAVLLLLFTLTACGSEEQENKTKNEPKQEVNNEEVAKKNAEKYPAKAGTMLYDKNESKFKGMEYYFKGTLVKTETLEGLFDEMQTAFLVKNEEGYIMSVFPMYEIEVNEGDEIEVWGNLSGDGYSSADLGVDNVVGVTGSINAFKINVNGETK